MRLKILEHLSLLFSRRLSPKKWMLWVLCFCLGGCSPDPFTSSVHVYSWFNQIPREVLDDFEKEFKIRVIYDVYESNDALEAKLLTGHSGYDVVFPSLSPYLTRQLKANVYEKLDKEKIPNVTFLDPQLLALVDRLPQGSAYALPFIWGITVIGYRADLVHKIFPEAPVNSLKMLYDLQTVQKLSKCGVSYLEEPIDIIPLALHYLGYSSNTMEPQALKTVVALLKKIRPYITQFSATRPLDDLVTGDVCVVQSWLDAILRAQDRAKDLDSVPDIRFSIPEEGTSMWLDVVAVPKDAPHKDNAYAFINFLLRPQNMARMTNETFLKNSVPASEVFLNPAIREGLKLPESVRNKILSIPVVDKTYMKSLTQGFQSIVSGE